jgi:hypothetical protein
MKHLLLVLILIGFTSCVTVSNQGSAYQNRNISNFSKAKGYKKGYARYVAPKKRGDWNHPSVTKQTRKRLEGK